jgi:hypothetical protein
MKIWRDMKDFILSYYYPKGQYFLVSFPKTGRTWLMHMINQLKELSNHPLKHQEQFIFNEHDNSEIIIENGYRNNPLDVFRFTGRNRYRRGKVIFLVRDPRDVVVSHFHQVTKRAKNPFVFDSISDFIKDETLGFNRIIHYYNLWHKNRNIPKEFLLIKYEHLLENGERELQKINEYLNLNISVSDIKKVYKNSSANKMRRKELANQLEGFNDFGNSRNQLKVRNAKIGGYVKELSEEDISYCNVQMEKLDSYFNYKV